MAYIRVMPITSLFGSQHSTASSHQRAGLVGRFRISTSCTTIYQRMPSYETDLSLSLFVRVGCIARCYRCFRCFPLIPIIPISRPPLLLPRALPRISTTAPRATSSYHTKGVDHYFPSPSNPGGPSCAGLSRPPVCFTKTKIR